MDLRADEKLQELCAFSTKQWQENILEQCGAGMGAGGGGALAFFVSSRLFLSDSVL